MNRSAVAAPLTPPDLAPRTPCLLVNPRSFNAARGALAARARELAQRYGASVVEASDLAQIDAAVGRASATPHRPVFVLAGDGTVQALVDRFAAAAGDVTPPQLLVLGGGRSNLTAADLGGSGAVLEKLEGALRRWRDGPALALEGRTVLRIEQAPLPPRHGFFLAAGLLDHIIRACHRDRKESRSRLGAGGAGTISTVLGLALSALLGRREPSLDELQLTLAGRSVLAEPARLLVATTLERCPGVPPSSGPGADALRVTAVAAGGVSLWSYLVRLAIARSGCSDSDQRCFSGHCDALQVSGLSSYTLDGEEFRADPARPVLIRPGPTLTFLTL